MRCAALVDLGLAAGLAGWATGSSYCSWPGVGCDAGADVVSLQPSGCYAGAGCQTSGQLPWSLGSLTALQSLSFEGDNFGGTLPASLSSLRQLQSLFLHSWSLTGTLDVLSGLPSLTSLRMLNSAITGSLPVPPALQMLDIFNIGFSGAIPPAYASLANLTSLKLDYMRSLSGPLPTFPASLTSLYISCQPDYSAGTSGCAFSGDLSAAIGPCVNLRSLYITRTTLSGVLSDAACPVLNGLSSCSLFGNQLGCPVPACLSSLACNPNNCAPSAPLALCNTTAKGGTDDPAQCAALVDLGVASNVPGWLTGSSYCTWPGVQCSGADVVSLAPGGCFIGGNSMACQAGQIPDSVGSLTALQSLTFDGDNFGGTLPASFGTLSQLGSLFLHSWSMNGTLDVLSGLPSLTSLRMLNSAITGALPAPPALQSLDIFNIRFSGAIPAAYATMANLSSIKLDYMQGLSGPLPTFPASLTSLYISCVASCFLTGDLSAAIAPCASLQSLSIAGTTLSGVLSDAACPVINNLAFCSLTGNQLGCPLPACVVGGLCDPNQCSLAG